MAVDGTLGRCRDAMSETGRQQSVRYSGAWPRRQRDGLTENAGLDIEGLICSGGHYRTGRCRTRLDIERRIPGAVMKFILMHVQGSYTIIK